MKSRSDFSSKEEYLNYLRVYYAGIILAGLPFNGKWEGTSRELINARAELAVCQADALIAELNKETI